MSFLLLSTSSFGFSFREFVNTCAGKALLAYDRHFVEMGLAEEVGAGLDAYEESLREPKFDGMAGEILAVLGNSSYGVQRILVRHLSVEGLRAGAHALGVDLLIEHGLRHGFSPEGKAYLDKIPREQWVTIGSQISKLVYWTYQQKLHLQNIFWSVRQQWNQPDSLPLTRYLVSP